MHTMEFKYDLAPISIPVYRRKDHLEKCISALLLSPLAKETILYLFSDYPREGDEKAVFALREMILKIVGFKEVVIVERTSNMGIQNIVEAMEVPLKTHGSVIYLEEDIVVSPGFLEYMNEALNKYKHNSDIFSVTGYAMPCSVEDGALRVKASSIFTAWGCGLWNSKYQKFRNYLIEGDPLSRMKSNKKLKYSLMYWHSITQYFIYKEKCSSKKLTPDMAIGFYIWHKKLLQVFPTRSLVSNQGMDGTGWNCGVTNRYNSKIISHGLDCQFEHYFSDKEVKSEFFKIRNYHGLNFHSECRTILKLLLPDFIVNIIRIKMRQI